MNRKVIRAICRIVKSANFIASPFLAQLLALTDAAAQNFWLPTNGPYGGIIQSFAFDSEGNVFAGSYRNGVFRLLHNDDKWTPVKNGMTGITILEVNSLVVNDSDYVLAGTSGGGAFLSKNRGDLWTQVNTGLPNSRVFSLAIDDSGHIYAGASDSTIFKLTNNGESWIKCGTLITGSSANFLAIDNDSGYIFASTGNAGFFRSKDDCLGWIKLPSPATGTSEVAVSSRGELFGGTGIGVFRSIDKGFNWTEFNSGLLDKRVKSLVISGDYLFAGTRGGGVFRSEQNSAGWTPQNFELRGRNVWSLGTNREGDVIVVGTQDGGVSFSTDDGESWTPTNNGLTAHTDIRLTADENGVSMQGLVTVVSIIYLIEEKIGQ